MAGKSDRCWEKIRRKKFTRIFQVREKTGSDMRKIFFPAKFFWGTLETYGNVGIQTWQQFGTVSFKTWYLSIKLEPKVFFLFPYIALISAFAAQMALLGFIFPLFISPGTCHLMVEDYSRTCQREGGKKKEEEEKSGYLCWFGRSSAV